MVVICIDYVCFRQPFIAHGIKCSNVITYGGVQMNCCITELRCKEIINKSNGCRLGFVSDIEVDKSCGRVVALIVYGRPKYFGICGRRERIRICWEDIDVIGSDTILVCKTSCEENPRQRRRTN